MKDLLIALAAIATALAGLAAVLQETKLSTATEIQENLIRKKWERGAALEEATRRVSQRKLLLLGIPLVLALVLSVAALTVSGDAKAKEAPTTSVATSRCPGLLGLTGGSSSGSSQTLKVSTTARARARARSRARARAKAQAIVALGAQGRPAAGAVALRIALGSDRDPVLRRQTFRISGVRARDVRVVSVNDLTDATGDHALPIARRQLLARTVAARATGRLVHVSLCFDPERPVAMRPGSYTGGFMVIAGRSAPIPIGITITARDDRTWPAVLAALLGLLAGIFVRIGADRRWGPIVIDATYVFNFRFWVMLGGGTSAAVYSYLTIYQADSVFDGSATSLWKLTAQTFAGTLASKAVTDLIGPTAKEIRGNKARRQTMAKPGDQILHEHER